MKISFNIGLVEVESSTISKNIFVTHFLATIVCFHPIYISGVASKNVAC